MNQNNVAHRLCDENGHIIFPGYARIVQAPCQPYVFPMSALPQLQAAGTETLVYHGMVYTAGNNPERPFIGLKKFPYSLRKADSPESIPCCFESKRLSEE